MVKSKSPARKVALTAVAVARIELSVAQTDNRSFEVVRMR